MEEQNDEKGMFHFTKRYLAHLIKEKEVRDIVDLITKSMKSSFMDYDKIGKEMLFTELLRKNSHLIKDDK